jgi:hypothetical protein
VIEATLPLPPSANNLFFNLKNGRRAKTTQYKDWQRIAWAALHAAYANAGRPPIEPKTRMRLTVRVGASYRRDISNCIKPIEDLLVAALPLPDDRYNDVVEVSRDLSIEGFAHVRIGAL